jgi:copper ion binding protein
MKTATLKATGMHCNGCEMNAQEFVSELDGVKKVKANFKNGEVKVEFDEKKTTLDAIKAKIAEAGYKPQ